MVKELLARADKPGYRLLSVPLYPFFSAKSLCFFFLLVCLFLFFFFYARFLLERISSNLIVSCVAYL